MSTYKKVTQHPLDRIYGNATWHDDYFGPHRHGVEFPADDVIYPASQVEDAQLKEFWTADVIEAFLAFLPSGNEKKEFDNPEDALLMFLKELNIAYKKRWERDPLGGEGAVEHYKNDL